MQRSFISDSSQRVVGSEVDGNMTHADQRKHQRTHPWAGELAFIRELEGEHDSIFTCI